MQKPIVLVVLACWSLKLLAFGGEPLSTEHWQSKHSVKLWFEKEVSREKSQKQEVVYIERQLCSGTFIAENWILTAAHCVPERSLVSISVHNVFGEKRVTDQVIVHPDYNPENFANDLALVYLPFPPKFSKPLPMIQEVGGREMAFLAGFGLLQNDLSSQASGGHLRNFNVLLDQDSVLRVEHDDQGACVGDSGGGLLVEEGLLAVLSRAEKVNRGDRSGCSASHYLKLAPYQGWIESEIAI